MTMEHGFLKHHLTTLQGCVESCEQLRKLIGTMTDAQYTGKVAGQSSPVGAHARHAVDHLNCLMNGVRSGTIDYDARERSQDLECSRAVMLARLTELEMDLLSLAGQDPERMVFVHSTASEDGKAVTVRSSLQRELLFVASHTIHHLALMRMMLVQQGATIDDRVGVAYSTLAHEGRSATGAT